MATAEINENCHYVQNDPHRFEIKLENFHFDFDILSCYGVIKASLPGGNLPPPPGEIGLDIFLIFKSRCWQNDENQKDNLMLKSCELCLHCSSHST